MAPPSKNNGDKTARTNLTAALNDAKNEFNRFHKGLTPAINSLANFQGTLNSTMVRTNTAVDLLTQAISKIKPDSVDTPTPTPKPVDTPAGPATPSPVTVDTPAGEDSPEAPQSGKKEPTGIKKLYNVYKDNWMAMGVLTGMIGKAMAVQKEISTALVSTGNIQAVASDRVSDTFNMRGLALGEAMQVLSAASLKGLDLSNRSTTKMLGRFTLLGKNMSGMADIVARNTQVLGMSQTWSSNLGDHLIELGHNFGVNTDTLVSALTTMSQTLIRSAAVYGKETSQAVMDATTNLVASYGDASKDMITSIANQLFAGTAASEKLAATLGLDASRLVGKTGAEMENLLLTGVENFANMLGSQRGTTFAGTTSEAVGKGVGVGDPANWLAMSELVAGGPTAGLSAEEIEQASIQADIMKGINDAVTKLTAKIIPVLGQVATVLEAVLPPIFDAILILAKPLMYVASTMMALLAFNKIRFAWTNRKYIWEKLVHAKNTLFNFAKLTPAMTTAANTTILSLGVGAMIAAIAMVAVYSAITSMSSEDSLDESKKQTSIMLGEKDKGQKMLQDIASAINRGSIYQEQQVILAENAAIELEHQNTQRQAENLTPADNTYNNMEKI